MTHETECPCCPCNPCEVACDGCPDCICDRLRAAYRRGYREGHNDHARAQQHWQDTHGTYRAAPEVDEDIALATEGGRVIDEWVKGMRRG